MNGFEVTALKKQDFLSKLLRRKDRRNAVVAVQNLLATTAIADISDDAIDRVLGEYGLSRKMAEESLCEVYADALRHCARDEDLSEAEFADLRKLRELFALSDEQVRQAERAVLDAVYRSALREAAGDRVLTDDERSRLEALVRGLKLPDDVVAAIRKEDLGALMQQVYDEVTADHRISADEDRVLAALAQQFDVTISHDDRTRAVLDRYRLLWRLENGELPDVPVPIRLQRGERCHAAIGATHYEHRTVTTRIRYAGPTARIRIMRGLSYRVGSLRVERVTQDVLKQLDTGQLYVTSKRLIFDGSRKSTAITYRKVLNITRYSDGIGVEKDTGKDQQQFEHGTNLDWIAADGSNRSGIGCCTVGGLRQTSDHSLPMRAA
jgi:hypothetical protein